jgi:hypothetical protein
MSSCSSPTIVWPLRLDLLARAVDVGDPVERLLRRRDVVAHRREDDDRLLDRLEVEVTARAEARLARRELVADEEVADDPADLFLAEEVEAAPPALELEVALDLGVDVRVQVVPLLPQRVRGIEVLEVLHEMRAVERPGAEVRCQQRQPRAAEQAARVAHRRLAVVARPVRHRRAVDHERSGDVGPRRGEHHDGPPALAIADDHGLLALRVTLGDDADELGLGIGDVRERLLGTGFGIEDDEVHGVARAQRHADLRVFLEASDAGAVAGARIDDHERPLGLVDLDVARRMMRTSA